MRIFSFFTTTNINWRTFVGVSEFLQIVGWVLLSSVKFIFAIIPLLVSSSRFWLYDMVIVALGGCLGVFVFTFLGRVISKYLSHYQFFKIKYKNLRRFVGLKNGYGLIGVAFLTPMLISIPVGCILSSFIEPDKWKVMRIQGSAVLFWSILMFSLKGLFNVEFGNESLEISTNLFLSIEQNPPSGAPCE